MATTLLASRKNQRIASLQASACQGWGCFSACAHAMKSRADWKLTPLRLRRQKLKYQRSVMA